MKFSNTAAFKGSFTIRTYDSVTNELLYTSPVIENKIVSGSGGYGRNLIIRQLTGDQTYAIEIDSAKIGSGTNAPSDSDTDLQTSVLAGIAVANVVIGNDSVVFTFYITNAQLANGTYHEFGLFCNGRLFARAIISPSFTKGANQNTVVDYTISLT